MSVASFTIDGVTYDIVPRSTPPTPPPDTVYVAVNASGATYPFSGLNPTTATNPTGAAYLGCRGPDQLVAYRAPLTVTPTNTYGAEVTVIDGRVIALWDRQTTPTSGTTIPQVPGGYVLSGHGKARDFILTNAKVGAYVQLCEKTDQPPPPGPGPQGRTVALYLKRGSARSDQIPPDVTQARIAFAQGSPPALVDWGGETTSEQAQRLAAWRAAAPGRQVLVSIGGAGGAVNPADRGRFLQGFTAIEDELGGIVDGIDWDLEGSALYAGFPDDAAAISSALAAGRKDRFIISFAPSGGNPVATYLTAAAACVRAGLKVQFGQQLYDAEVSQSAALDALARAISAGIPPSSILVGTMVGLDTRHWTIPTCVQVITAARGRWPNLGGTYLWSENYTEDDEWARCVAAALSG